MTDDLTLLIRAFEHANGNSVFNAETLQALVSLHVASTDTDCDQYSTKHLFAWGEDAEPATVSRNRALELLRAKIENERLMSKVMLFTALGRMPQTLEDFLLFNFDIRQKSHVVRDPVLVRLPSGRYKTSFILRGAPSVNHWWIHLAAVLLVDEHGLVRRIGHCRLASCDQFFLIISAGRGKPRKDYCCNEHMMAAHKANSTERSRRARERKRLNSNKPAGRRRIK